MLCYTMIPMYRVSSATASRSVLVVSLILLVSCSSALRLSMSFYTSLAPGVGVITTTVFVKSTTKI